VRPREAPCAPGAGAFPRLRWVALVWLVGWTAAYARGYGWANFLQLCDLAVVLTCLGLWLGSPLLLSAQALSALVIHLAWDLDVAWRAATGRHLIGGTEYMFDSRFPLALRLLSFFHLAWPPLLWWALGRVGYDRRALLAQSAFAAAVIAVSPWAMPNGNLNFSRADPVFHRAWGAPAAHVALTAAALVAVIYLPTHALLARARPRPRPAPGARVSGVPCSPEAAR
jgi:hypothetical protein